MKVVYACHQFFPEFYTGTERYTLELAKQIQRMGHHVSCLTYATTTPTEFRSNAAELLETHFDFEGLSVFGLKHSDLSTRGGLGEVSLDVGDRAIFETTFGFLKDHPADIVHCVHPLRVGSVVRAAKELGIKVVLHLMDFWLLCPRGILQRQDGSLCDGPEGGESCIRHCFDGGMADRLRLRVRNAQALLRDSDVVIAHSKFVIDVFARNGLDTKDFLYLPNGMDHSKRTRSLAPRRRDRPLRFGFLGTLAPHKGSHIILRALRSVRSPNIEMDIYGGHLGHDDYRHELLSLAKGDSRINFKGVYDYNEIESIVNEMDVVIVPSLWYENRPLVISTAQMFGIPVIASDLGGMAEMIEDGVNGFTFPMGDSRALAETIERIARNPGLLGTLREGARPPPRIETEAFYLETIYGALLNK